MNPEFLKYWLAQDARREGDRQLVERTCWRPEDWAALHRLLKHERDRAIAMERAKSEAA